MNEALNLQKEMSELFMKAYKAQLSENIKRGIRLAKERKQKNENK